MIVSYLFRSRKFFIAFGVMTLFGMILISGCSRLTVVPEPSPLPIVGPTLISSDRVLSPTVEPSATPLPPTPKPAADTKLSAAPEPGKNRIVLSFAQESYEHLYSFHPLEQPFVQLTSGEWDDRDPAVSPDGSKIAFTSNRSGYWDLYILDLTSQQTSQVTQSQDYDGAPSWSPDGQWLAYETYNGMHFDIIVAPVNDPSTPSIQLTQNSGNNYAPDWSPGGREIVFTSDRSGANEIWNARLDLAEDRFVKIVGIPGVSYTTAVWSPDGSALAWTRTVNGESTVELAQVAKVAQSLRSYGPGSNPVWSPDGSSILVQNREPNSSYLIAYTTNAGLLLFPAQTLPSSIHGADWHAALSTNGAPLSSDSPPINTAGSPLWQTEISRPVGIQDRKSLVPIAGLDAPYPYLQPTVDESFSALRSATGQKLGWDLLAKLDDAVLPISAPPQPGLSDNWLYTGRAINLNSAPLLADWMSVSREDYGGKVYWRVWVRCFNQDGSCGSPQKTPSWDFSSRYEGDEQAYEEGGKTGTIPSGYWVDFTDLALAYHWERLASASNWRAYFQGTLFNQFVLREGLTWQDAMLQLYPSEALQGTQNSVPLPIQQ